MAFIKRSRTPSSSSTTSLETKTAFKVAHLSRHTVQEHVITCSLPHVEVGAVSFPSYSTYEEHYSSCHTNRCLSPDCHRNFPSPHYLSLHITENHDPIAEARKARGDKIYACFVEGCDKLCRDWKKRRAHLVDKHGFPRDYEFLVIDNGVDGRRSMLRTPSRKHKKNRYLPDASDEYTPNAVRRTGETAMIADNAAELGETAGDIRGYVANHVSQASCRESAGSMKRSDTEQLVSSGSSLRTKVHSASSAAPAAEIDMLTQSMSALKFVPPSVRFGRGVARGGLGRR